ncbi:hypothetical protein F4823DRAFT_587821 [Ustulina deusta]|nr:hypothetical protein F4823DRAFT_587821 [Ustulina deusta]
MKVEQLVHDRTPPNTDNIWGRTPLWVASANGHQKIVNFLITRPIVNISSKSTVKSLPYTWPLVEIGDTAAGTTLL